MYLLGYDSGTSSIKVTLLEAASGRTVCSASSPEKEMPIISRQNGWAEQNPQLWWENIKLATAKILAQSKVSPSDIKAIGIYYQMHGLVIIDKKKRVLRPSIIWCDSRAVKTVQKALKPSYSCRLLQARASDRIFQWL